jgi:hypothetical protein
MFAAASLASLGLAGATGAIAHSDGRACRRERKEKEHGNRSCKIRPGSANALGRTGWLGQRSYGRGISDLAEYRGCFPAPRSWRDSRTPLAYAGRRVSLHARWAVISPNGQGDVSDFGPGDTCYFPRGAWPLPPCIRTRGLAISCWCSITVTSPNWHLGCLRLDRAHRSECAEPRVESARFGL